MGVLPHDFPVRGASVCFALGLALLWCKVQMTGVSDGGSVTDRRGLGPSAQLLQEQQQQLSRLWHQQEEEEEEEEDNDDQQDVRQRPNDAGREVEAPPKNSDATRPRVVTAPPHQVGCGRVTEGDNTITVYVQNPRTGGMFLSGKFASYSTSGKYKYVVHRIKDMNPRLTKGVAEFLHEVCETAPGFKIFVYDSGATPNFVLKHWPAHTVLVLTGDESGRWGLYHSKRYWGPFGEGNEEVNFDMNSSSPLRHIILPPSIRPWYRQYYDAKQQQAFGSAVRFIPLGSRVEFPTYTDSNITSASKRKYVFSLMASNTDESRKRLTQILTEDTTIPEEQKYIHMAKNWHPELTNEAYVAPEQYGQIMLDSMFTPCPKGRSLDTFRLYEAMECGSIPVIELNDGYARDHLPPEMFDSPILFVESWEDSVAAMRDLAQDARAIDKRQKDVQKWYKSYMQGIVRDVEALLESRRKAS